MFYPKGSQGRQVERGGHRAWSAKKKERKKKNSQLYVLFESLILK